ncbi:MAG TPA: HAMP domain-containing sensor histidine kinase, partial [Holophagaceae bacterium]
RTLRREAEACLDHPVARFLLASLDGLVLILDAHRQVLATNARVQELAGASAAHLQGRRPGEVFGCIQVKEGPDGCGTSRACAHCGAVLAVLEAQRTGKPVRSECLLRVQRDGGEDCVEFEIAVDPLQVGPHRFQVVLLRDLGPAKRRDALERLFFHDVSNLMQGIRGWTDLLAAGDSGASDVAEKLARLTDLLDRELRSYRAMVQAEHGEFRPRLRDVLPAEILQDVGDLLARHAKARTRAVILLAVPAEPLRTDPELLSRVLLNMAVNAAEAIPPGAAITLSARREDGRLRFQVHNPGEMSEEVRSRIFLRSFSTKGETGRGLGTYAMKLFGEKVLGGQVGFDSGPDGTTFWIELAVHPC